VALGPSVVGDGVRADIQALRAIAVGSVLLYHLWPNRLTGGYVGVDVFFAISGFLITSHLLAEIDATGRLRPGRFWARRAKRLVPASTLVLLVTALGVVTWVPRYLWLEFLGEIIASTVQAQNWLLAHNSVDYFAPNNSPSPTQHFWTLSAEEQFYVALPLLLLASIVLARVLRLGHRRIILAALMLIVACSLGYSIWLTAKTPGVAYFSTLTRAWEFAAGALLAFAAVSRRRHRILPWVAAAGIVATCFWYDGQTPFPGVAAALPVVGTMVVIWSGRGGSTFDRFGAWPPVALLGRASYAAYLWHWPLIVLLPHVTHRALGTVDKAGIIATRVALAWASTTFVEDPIRFRPRLLGQRRPRTVAAWSAAAMLVVIGFSLVAANAQMTRNKELTRVTERIVAQMPRCLGAQAMDPDLAPCHNPDLSDVLVPDATVAQSDNDNMDSCWGLHLSGEPKVCALGPAAAYSKRILAVGDSHNNTLIGVYRRLAERNSWRIDVAGQSACYLTTARQIQPSDVAEKDCDSLGAGVRAIAREGGYDAVIVTHEDRETILPGPGETAEQATVRGLLEAWRGLPEVPIVAIRDNPRMPTNILDCVAEHPSTAAQECAVPRRQALAHFDGHAEAVRQTSRARLVDMTSLYCTATVCSPVIGHVLVYKDPAHISATYAATLSPYIEKQVVAAITP